MTKMFPEYSHQKRAAYMSDIGWIQYKYVFGPSVYNEQKLTALASQSKQGLDRLFVYPAILYEYKSLIVLSNRNRHINENSCDKFYSLFKDHDHLVLVLEGIVQVEQFGMMQLVHDVDLVLDGVLVQRVRRVDELGNKVASG